MEQVSPEYFFPRPQYSSLCVNQNMAFEILACYKKNSYERSGNEDHILLT